MSAAVARVEANRRLVVAGLKATGSIRLRFVDEDGKRRHFDLQGKLQVVEQTHLRLAMQTILGRDVVEVGMNDAKWWVWMREPEDHYYEGAPGESELMVRGALPLRAEQLMESLGLTELPAVGPAQRVVDEYQQLLFVSTREDGGQVIEKEYWLDRYAPWLIRRIVFRDEEGRVVLSSELDDYRAVGSGGLQLPHSLRLRWPAESPAPLRSHGVRPRTHSERVRPRSRLGAEGAEMVFQVRRWRELDSLGAGHRAFVSPRDRGVRFESDPGR